MASKKTFNDQTAEELRLTYADLSRDIFRVNSEAKMARHLEKPHRLKALRRDRARVMTALREKNATPN